MKLSSSHDGRCQRANALRRPLIIEAITITVPDRRPHPWWPRSPIEPEPALPEPLRKSWTPSKQSGCPGWVAAGHHLTQQIINPTYRNEYLDRVVEGWPGWRRSTEIVR
jgi:hypothetical protein